METTRRFTTCLVSRPIAGVTGGIGPHAYSVAKCAVIGMTKNVAAELCHFGIRVNAIAPATMATLMPAGMLVGDPDHIEELKVVLAKDSPLGRSDWPRTSRKRPSGWHRTTPAT